MVLWITFGASIFVGFYILEGGQRFVADSLIATGLGSYGILLLAVPIFVPPMKTLSFDGLLGLPGARLAHEKGGRAMTAFAPVLPRPPWCGIVRVSAIFGAWTSVVIRRYAALCDPVRCQFGCQF